MNGDSLTVAGAGGVRLHADLHGRADGEPVLLLHGFPETGRTWDALAPRLAAAGRRAIVPDLRGYGKSDAPQAIADYRLEALVADAAALLDAAGADRATVVGHDWGGIVAWALAGWRPERVARLVILNAPHPAAFRAVLRRHPGQLARSAYVGLFQLPRLPERLLAARNFALLRRMMTGSAREGTFPPALLDGYARDWARPGRLTAMLHYYRALLRHRPKPVGRIEPPVRVVWGREDVALSFPLAPASLALCRAGRLDPVEATHWVHREAPDAVLEAIFGDAS